MRRFNPERELNKIQHGNRNKIIFGITTLLLIIAIGSSYALYQVRFSKRIIYTKVAPFNNKDLNLAVYLDNEPTNDFPTIDQNYVYDRIECENNNDNHVKAYWDYEKWGLVVETTKKAKCNVYFKTGTDKSGANPPELYQGLIPVTIDNDGTMKVADLGKEWYNYDNHEWANAVLIDDTKNHNKYYKDDGSFNAGVTMDLESDILQMYVWIPRYKYQLFNAVPENISSEQMINIKFERSTETTGKTKCETSINGVETCLYDDNNNWYTHPAFTFGETELLGFWAGKFEPSDPTDNTGRTMTTISEITILPNKTSMVNKTVSTTFNAEQNLTQEKNKYNLDSSVVDTHMMKNSEWGAIAYLTNSRYGRYIDENTCIDGGCEVWINNIAQGTGENGDWNYGGTYTGCAGKTATAQVEWNQDSGAPAKCDEDKRWNTENGVKASTTGNVYGIYDMSGGAWDYVMAVTVNQSGNEVYYAGSGFSKNDLPESKYYDLYEYSDTYLSHKRGHLGDATRETLKIYGNGVGGWNNDYSWFPFYNNDAPYAFPWFLRGGRNIDGTYAGMFAFHRANGTSDNGFTFRSIISKK